MMLYRCFLLLPVFCRNLQPRRNWETRPRPESAECVPRKPSARTSKSLTGSATNGWKGQSLGRTWLIYSNKPTGRRTFISLKPLHFLFFFVSHLVSHAGIVPGRAGKGGTEPQESEHQKGRGLVHGEWDEKRSEVVNAHQLNLCNHFGFKSCFCFGGCKVTCIYDWFCIHCQRQRVNGAKAFCSTPERSATYVRHGP